MSLARRRSVLLDSNVLLLLYVGMLDPELISEFKRTRQYTRSDFELLKSIVNEFRSLVTTPHVLAEVSNLSLHLPQHHRADYFVLFARALVLLEEAHRPAEILAGEVIFGRLCLTDAAISQIARDDSLTVITADLDLYLHLLSIGVRAVNFNEVSTLGMYVQEMTLS